jgi:hypothetical protein
VHGSELAIIEVEVENAHAEDSLDEELYE